MQDFKDKVGIVVIGRNEGERLKRCLRSVHGKANNIVYVDSGSTDGSVEFAKSLDVDVVELDMSRQFTMARGRNAGFKHLMEIDPSIELVQFIDGDCEMVDGYLETAVRTMIDQSDITVVVGKRLERYPEASIYNHLCDIEWGKELGEIESCGGDMMVRAEVFGTVGMFNHGMIAGEEPELCVRLRRLGGKIVRIDHDMTIHDAAIHKFSQWWKRAERGGHAYAEGAAMHGRSAERHKVRNVRSVLFWGAAVPSAMICCTVAAIWWPWALAGLVTILAGYFLLAAKIKRAMQSSGFEASDARLYAVACIVAKFPCFIGIIQYWLNHLLGRQNQLIEYKQAANNEAGEQKSG